MSLEQTHRDRESGTVAVIGADIGGTKIEVALATVSGEILDRVRIPSNAADGPDQAFTRLGKVVEELRHRADVGHGLAVAAIAAVSPGVVQAERILLAPNLPGWEGVALAHEIRMLAGLDVVAVTNDVKAGALAELRFGALRDVDPGIYVNLGTGIAAAVTVHGQVLPGAHQASGEIGYFVSDVATGGERLQPRPALEEIIGGKALGERASVLLAEEIASSDLFDRRDPVSTNLVHHALGALAAALVNISVLLDPERIVLGGGMMASSNTILPVLQAYLVRFAPFPPVLALAKFAEDASLHGAVALAADALAEAQISAHRSVAPNMIKGVAW